MDRGFLRKGELALAAIGIAAGLVALDAAVDPDQVGLGEVAVDFIEKLILVGAMIFIARLVGRLGAVERDTARLGRDLAHARREGEAWRNRSRAIVKTLSDAIAAQLEDWGLTPAETDIAGLMLKGMSLKDIARARGVSEATIRQQAQGIYRKSGLSGRAELSAYFLEDLLETVEGQNVARVVPLNQP